jgi:hypothetical protein
MPPGAYHAALRRASSASYPASAAFFAYSMASCSALATSFPASEALEDAASEVWPQASVDDSISEADKNFVADAGAGIRAGACGKEKSGNGWRGARRDCDEGEEPDTRISGNTGDSFLVRASHGNCRHASSSRVGATLRGVALRLPVRYGVEDLRGNVEGPGLRPGDKRRSCLRAAGYGSAEYQSFSSSVSSREDAVGGEDAKVVSSA